MSVSHRHAARCRRAATGAAVALLLAPVPGLGPGRGAGLAGVERREAPAPAAEESPTPSFFDVNKYRADPGNPGAIKIPGTNVALYIGGFAQLDVITDVNVTGTRTSSSPRPFRWEAAPATRGSR